MVVTVPAALKNFVGVVHLFQRKEIPDLRVSGRDVMLGRPAMVGQIKRTVILKRTVQDGFKVVQRRKEE